MHLTENLIDALSGQNISRIDFCCGEDLADEALRFFTDTFEKEWVNAVEKIEDDYGDCESVNNPIHTAISSDGFCAVFEPLDIPYCFGDYCDNEKGNDALQFALKHFHDRYPAIHYEGYIGYSWSDVHGGESVEYTVSSEEDNVEQKYKLYDSVGKGLASAVEGQYFWDQMEYIIDADGAEAVLKVFFKYEKWLPEDAIDKLLDFAEEYDEGSRKDLENLLLALENGEESPFEEGPDISEFPDGYEEAVALFEYAKRNGMFVPRNTVVEVDDALKIVAQEAGEGDPEAQYVLGRYIQSNSDAKEDFAFSAELLSTAAQQGYKPAIAFLREIGVSEEGLTEIEGEDIEELMEQAETGDANAQYKVALYYMPSDDGKDADLSLALEWFSKAAENGHEMAAVQFRLWNYVDGLMDKGEIPRNADFMTIMGTIINKAENGDEEAQRALE